MNGFKLLSDEQQHSYKGIHTDGRLRYINVLWKLLIEHNKDLKRNHVVLS